jgi:glycosyltransferase involved in cell wall biosynthesis
VFVYPSSIEGFGLPPLEAMSNGTPVVGSDKTSVPEIINDAGIIVDPENSETLAEAMYDVVTDESLKQDLIKKGYDRVNEFSWDRTAENTHHILTCVYRNR